MSEKARATFKSMIVCHLSELETLKWAVLSYSQAIPIHMASGKADD